MRFQIKLDSSSLEILQKIRAKYPCPGRLLDVEEANERIRLGEFSPEQLRNLYGVVGIVQGSSEKHQYFYRGFLIPPENHSALEEAESNLVFEKKIISGDRSILRHLIRRTREIKNNVMRGHNPRFSVPRIMKELRIKDRLEVRESLERLTGVLCHTYGPLAAPYNVDENGTRVIYFDNWFIPNMRMNLAEGLIK